ncbi:laminin subunit alpha-2-like isoform X2 [Gigantopelta aegis]|uniref:laminin subunit alpha-2-like isoform X2 n=1 Tax=Gigantopelta aegis TaxID=1735272 RepID=UPI001B88E412|nr:laminin subunit alpha-2-like isoform X2 [Gigantopelta aegis]
MGINKIYQVIFLGLLCVIFFSHFVDGRGILRKRRSRKPKIEMSMLVRKQELLQRQRNQHVNIERRPCPGCDVKPEQTTHRHRHKHGYRNMKQKTDDKKDKHEFTTKTGGLSIEQTRNTMAADDASAAVFDHDNQASYDQYGAGFGRAFPRLQRPPAADRLERRLHPSIRASARDLLNSMDRVLRAMNQHLQKLHSSYDFVFNSTRYVMMMGAREGLHQIAKANHEILDVVLDTHLLTKYIYMRAHLHDLTGPTTQSLDRPHFVSLRVQLGAATEEERQADRQERNMFNLKMQCDRVNARREQVAERMSEYSDRGVFYDLMRHINRTSQTLLQFDESVVFKRLARYKGLERLHDILVTAQTQVRVAKHSLRQAANNFRGSNLVYIDWKIRKEGTHGIAPVSLTDNRQPPPRERGQSSRLTDTDIARRKAIRNRVRNHISQVKSATQDIKRTFPSLIATSKRIVSQGGRGKSGLGLLEIKLREYIQNINMALDRIRLAIDDETELRQRCEELDVGSGDSGESPIDCDTLIEEGSGSDSKTDGDKTIISNPDTDFEFVGETIVDKKKISSSARLADKIDAHTQNLLAKSKESVSRANDVAKIVKDQTSVVATIRKNINAVNDYIVVAKNFTSNYGQPLSDAQTMDSRVRSIAEKIRTLSNVTRIRTAEAVLKAQKKLDEVRGGGGSKPAGTGNGKGVDEGRATITQAIELTTKAKKNIGSIVSLKRGSPMTCGSVKQRVIEIRSNISELRRKVEKARLVLSTLQVSISKTEAGYIPVPMKSVDDTPSVVTSMEVCVKPQTMYGVILVLVGNNSQSHVLSLYDGYVYSYVYDAGGYEQGNIKSTEKLAINTWYSIIMKRIGHAVTLSVISEDGQTTDTTEAEWNTVKYLEPPPAAIFLGGWPDTVPMSQNMYVWKGCVGGVRINGQSLGLLQKGSDGKTPRPCNSSCSPAPATQSMVFEGNGFLHFPSSVLTFRPTLTVLFEFQTHQANTFLMSFNEEQQRFLSTIRLEAGTIVIEMPSSGIILRSKKNTYNNGIFHKLTITYTNRAPRADVNGVETFSTERVQPRKTQNEADGIFVGGKASDASFKQNKDQRWLMGCVQTLQLNGNPLLMSDVVTSTGVYLGSCNSNSIWRDCVEFMDGSEALSFEDEADGSTILLSVSRTGRGLLVNYQKEEKFNIEIEATNGSIEISESIKNKKGSLKIPGDFSGHFIFLTIKDSSSAVSVSAMGNMVDLSYGGGGGWLFVDTTKDNLPHSITVGGGGDDEGSRQFYGGISQLMIGKKYIDLQEHISSNKLSSCSRQIQSMKKPATDELIVPC